MVINVKNITNLDPHEYSRLCLVIRHISADDSAFVSFQSSVQGKVLPRLAEQRKSLTLGGIRYDVCDSTKKAKNSFVQYRRFTGDIACGQITGIFLHERNAGTVDAFITIARFHDLNESDSSKDPYRQFPRLGARLYYSKRNSSETIRSTDLISHIACCPYDDEHSGIGEPCVVAISLLRVCKSHGCDLELYVLIPTSFQDISASD